MKPLQRKKLFKKLINRFNFSILDGKPDDLRSLRAPQGPAGAHRELLELAEEALHGLRHEPKLGGSSAAADH